MRVPMSPNFHPGGLVGLCFFGVVILLGDHVIFNRPIQDYVVPGLLVLALMLAQLILDIIWLPDEYLMRTTKPPVKIAPRRWILMKLPYVLISPLFPSWGIGRPC